jgi:hypothetical protein
VKPASAAQEFRAFCGDFVRAGDEVAAAFPYIGVERSEVLSGSSN